MPSLISLKRRRDGWLTFARVFRMALIKKHGAGRQRLGHAYLTAQAARWIVDGQWRGAPEPISTWAKRKRGLDA